MEDFYKLEYIIVHLKLPLFFSIVNKKIIDWLIEWMNKCMNERMNTWMPEWMREWMNVLFNLGTSTRCSDGDSENMSTGDDEEDSEYIVM